jgi:hypothetical protein
MNGLLVTRHQDELFPTVLTPETALAKVRAFFNRLRGEATAG